VDRVEAREQLEGRQGRRALIERVGHSHSKAESDDLFASP
jgi:hypothetical protein